MRGYDSTSYGDGFADVYDEWYADVTDVAATVALVTRFAFQSSPDARPTVLELGVGTGRLAVPIAAAGPDVVGVDSSESMLQVLRRRLAEAPASPPSETAAPTAPPWSSSGAGSVTTICGDMVGDLPDRPFDAILVAYNTLFNLLDRDEQSACFAAVAARLATNGVFIVEAIVPDPEAPAGTDVTVRSMAADRVVLTVSDHRPAEQRTDGQFIELSETGGVRLRPWAIRWCGVDELDAMASASGLRLVERTADMAGNPFDERADTHVSVYRRG